MPRADARDFLKEKDVIYEIRETAVNRHRVKKVHESRIEHFPADYKRVEAADRHEMPPVVYAACPV